MSKVALPDLMFCAADMRDRTLDFQLSDDKMHPEAEGFDPDMQPGRCRGRVFLRMSRHIL